MTVPRFTTSPAIEALRARRPEVQINTDASRALLFSDTLPTSLSVADRYAIAAYAARLSGDPELEGHYLTQAGEAGLDYDIQHAVAVGDVEALDDDRLRTVLAYVEVLVRRPREGDRAWIAALQTAGLTPDDVVALSQLIAFLTYEIRLTSGLRAIQGAL
jgi:uncharacterized protein YciW